VPAFDFSVADLLVESVEAALLTFLGGLQFFLLLAIISPHNLSQDDLIIQIQRKENNNKVKNQHSPKGGK